MVEQPIRPESATPIIEFVETIYLPMVKQFLRPSTYKDYKRDVWEKHFKHRLANLRLRDFRTAHGQRLISAVAKENPELGHKTLLRLKSFLSGVFRHARTEGYLDDQNPMRDVSLPRSVRRVKFKGDTYTVKEITTLLANVYWQINPVEWRSRWWRLPRLRGCAWRNCADCNGETSRARNCRWGEPCGERRKDFRKQSPARNTVPVLPILRSMLEKLSPLLDGFC